MRIAQSLMDSGVTLFSKNDGGHCADYNTKHRDDSELVVSADM